MAEKIPTRIRRDMANAERECSLDVYRIAERKDVTVIFDIGAYHGSFSRQCRLLYPVARVFAFEPSPDSFAKLAKTTPGVGLFNYAVAAKPGTATLYLSHVPSCNSLRESPRRETGDSVQVDCVTLPGIMLQFYLSHISILKIDCEGFEADILASVPNKRVLEYVCGEWHSEELRQKVQDILTPTHHVVTTETKPGVGYFFAELK